MSNNLRMYHKILNQLCQWLPDERITRMRNLSLLVTGLYLSGAVQMPLVARKWHLPGKEPSRLTACVAFLATTGCRSRPVIGP